MSLPYPVLTTVPDFSTPPDYGVATDQDMLSSAYGTARVAFPQTQTDFTFAFAFTLITAAEIDYLSDFFRSRCGRAHPFYLPSWRRDLGEASGPTGSHYLAVAIGDYGATHLTPPATRGDHYGRQIFIWKQGSGLWTDRVVSSVDSSGSSILSLERPLPFTVTPEDSIAGFLYLSRFSEDELQWKHKTPEIATVAGKFRGIRQWNGIGQTNPVTEIQIYDQRGFISVEQDTEPVSPVSNRYAVALGPDTLYATQAGAHVKSWAVWEQAGVLRIKAAASITYPDTGGTVSALSGGDVLTGHMALAFDLTGWEVVALEKAGTVEIRARGISPVTFPGASPVLINNRLISPSMDAADSDVICYYIKPGDAGLYARFQRDDYAEEKKAASLPFRPIALKRSTYSGTVHTLECLDAGFRRARLISPPFAP